MGKIEGKMPLGFGCEMTLVNKGMGWGTKGPFVRPRCIGNVRAGTQILINQRNGIGVCGVDLSG